MDVTSLSSAFIGSFLGVMSGFFGAVYLDWRRNRHERRTHILALTREILSNNVRVQLLLKEGRREGGLEDRAWRELRIGLAGELPMEFYNRLASRYDVFGTMRQAYEELSDGDADEERREKLSGWAEQMMEENDRLRVEIGFRDDGLLRVLRRRERRHAERKENNKSDKKTAAEA